MTPSKLIQIRADLNQIIIFWPSVAVCNPATMKTGFRNEVGSIPEVVTILQQVNGLRDSL